MRRHEGPLNVTQSGGDIRIGLNFNVSPEDWPDEAIDRLMEAVETVEPETVAEQFVRMGYELQEAEDRILELERDGQLKINTLQAQLDREKCMGFYLAVFAAVGWLVAIGFGIAWWLQ